MPVTGPTPELIEKFIAAGVWQDRPLHAIVDEHAAARPDALAVADQHERLSYAEFVRRTHAVGRFLRYLGLEPGTAVAVQSGNRLALSVAHMACSRADLVFVPLSTAWRHNEIEHLLAVSTAEVLVVPHSDGGVDYLQLVTELRDQLPALRHVGTLDGPTPGADFDFDEVSRREVEPLVLKRDPNDARYVMVTSGTTESPRMSLWSDNNLWVLIQDYIRAIRLTEDDVAVGLSPANTGAVGYVYPVLAPLMAGASSVLLEKWSVQGAFRLIEDERATTATAVPTQVVKMLQSDIVRDQDYSRLRVGVHERRCGPASARAWPGTSCPNGWSSSTTCRRAQEGRSARWSSGSRSPDASRPRCELGRGNAPGRACAGSTNRARAPRGTWSRQRNERTWRVRVIGTPRRGRAHLRGCPGSGSFT